MTHLYLIAQLAGRAVAIDSNQVESVVDTHTALGLDSSSEARRAVITHVEGHHYALLVDALDDVAPFELLPLAGGVALAWQRAGRGIVERDGEPILAIDLAALVPGYSAALN
jgi:purine-binding chemotaxis protein CheW